MIQVGRNRSTKRSEILTTEILALVPESCPAEEASKDDDCVKNVKGRKESEGKE